MGCLLGLLSSTHKLQQTVQPHCAVVIGYGVGYLLTLCVLTGT
jgi:hypothetical protein